MSARKDNASTFFSAQMAICIGEYLTLRRLTDALSEFTERPPSATRWRKVKGLLAVAVKAVQRIDEREKAHRAHVSPAPAKSGPAPKLRRRAAK